MKLKVLCDCKEDKVITGQFDGEMIWREKTIQEVRNDEKEFTSFNRNPMFSDLEQWKKEEAYEANSQ